ncbi:MAG TPA: hypothetical protein VJ553_07025 [Candidatus Paceibacterota bacterium]|nr:hypothetical protein [Candidatus Paceibacterota bacterium]
MRTVMCFVVAALMAAPVFAWTRRPCNDKERAAYGLLNDDPCTQRVPDRNRFRVVVGGAGPLDGHTFKPEGYALTNNADKSIHDLLRDAGAAFGGPLQLGPPAEFWVWGSRPFPVRAMDTFPLYQRRSAEANGGGSGTFNLMFDARLVGNLWLQTGWQLGEQVTFNYDNTFDYLKIESDFFTVGARPPRFYLNGKRYHTQRRDEFKVRGHALSAALKYDLVGKDILTVAPLVGGQLWLVRNRLYVEQHESSYDPLIAEDYSAGASGGLTDFRNEVYGFAGEEGVTHQHRWQEFVGLELGIGGKTEESPMGVVIQGRYVVGPTSMEFIEPTPYGYFRIPYRADRWYVSASLSLGF